MAQEIKTKRKSTAKNGMSLHHYIATGGKPKERKNCADNAVANRKK